MVNKKSYPKHFEEIQDEIKFLSNSESRLKVLTSLINESLSIKDINEKTDISYSSISGIISKLEQESYIKKKNNCYCLTNIGRIKIHYLLSCNKSLNIIDELSEFFNNHNVKPFNYSYNGLAFLSTFKLIKSSVKNIHKATDVFSDYFVGSKHLKIIFPYLHPNKFAIFEDWLEQEVDVELILASDVYDALADIIKNWEVKDKIRNKSFKVKIFKKPIDIALVISDKGVALGLFKKDGSFDLNTILTSSSDEARLWANVFYSNYETLCDEYINLNNIIYKNKEDKL